MSSDSLELERRLAAAQKTIDVLMRRVEGKVASGESAFAALEQSIVLERVVAEKTAQLEAQRARLEETLTVLGQTQAELVQAQKLESVGRLASGIAHEINTPVQFVSDSISFVRDIANQIISLVQRYRALRLAATAGGGVLDAAEAAELGRLEEEIEVDYLLDKVPKALDRALEGLDRVATLVRSMKDFAHPDHREKDPADLNRALTSTLTIARNEYKYVAELETDFGELPFVSCYLGELNQVFLNLIVNAAHAIAEANHGKDVKGRIRVQTRREGDQVRVSISDDGTGIPEEIRHRIFDPFFTTKEVGKGTGQGLSIARSVIVEKHGGTLTFDTEVGHGTTFHVRLPIGASKDCS